MAAASKRIARLKRIDRAAVFIITLGGLAVVVGVLEELPFICPVAVAIGSLIMMGMTLWKDWPQ